MGLVEIASALFGLICVVLTIKEHIWCWPTGLVQVILAIFVYWHARLYSDLILHVIYVVMSVYGWYNWLHGGADKGRLFVTRLSPLGLLLWTSTAAAGTGLLGLFMDRLTNADLPYWDASTTVLSLIAQYLLTEKKLESFMAWILVDVLCIGIYFYKSLYAFTLEYAAFLVLAATGLLAWRKSWKNRQPV
ncbi:MAG: nicotinamide riboside transporter PnuC [Thermodesulfobacteriota bacterium]